MMTNVRFQGSAEPLIQWVPCFHTNGDKYRSACEAKFGDYEPAISAYSSQVSVSALLMK